MQSPFKKILLAILLLSLGATVLLNLINSKFQNPVETVSPKIAKADFQYHYAPPATHVAPNSPATNSDDAEEQAQAPKISREQTEAWLAKHNRNAMSLLAAFRASSDTNYLNEAATNFPNDPHVELAVLARDEFPADRRKWLDLFKNSSPSNSLANYFSAEDYFKNGNKDAAVSELLAASGKPQFENYSMENQLDAEELYLDSSTDRRIAISYAMSDMADENMPELATFKKIGIGIKDLQQQYSTSGDADSVASLAQMGTTLANQLQSGDSGKYLINGMVGEAVEKNILAQLDQNTAYDFLGGKTPAQLAETLKEQKAELRQLMTDSGPAQLQMMQSESETANYMKRMQIYGEVAAMKWVIQQHPPVDSAK